MDDNAKGRGVSIGGVVAQQIDEVYRTYAVKDTQDLVVEEGETVVVSRNSKRFQNAFRKIQPKTAEELRMIIGIQPEVAKMAKMEAAGGCGCGKKSRTMSEDDLESADDNVRGKALSSTRAALGAFVRGASLVAAAKPSIDKYIELVKPDLIAAFFLDITVNNGATLTIAASAHALYARNIRIHGTGRIVCHGPTTINCKALSGDYHVRPGRVSVLDVGLTAAARPTIS
jgi:hypothetical protein